MYIGHGYNDVTGGIEKKFQKSSYHLGFAGSLGHHGWYYFTNDSAIGRSILQYLFFGHWGCLKKSIYRYSQPGSFL